MLFLGLLILSLDFPQSLLVFLKLGFQERILNFDRLQLKSTGKRKSLTLQQ